MFGEQQRFMLFLIAPAALLMLLFQVLPIAIGANASFRNWALYNPKKTWVGLDHYFAVITDPAFLYVVLPNTFLFMVLSVAGALVAGLSLALLLNRPFRGQKLVQTTAAISGGSSGGGLFDAKGNLIGITTFKIRDAESLNFAISIDEYLKP